MVPKQRMEWEAMNEMQPKYLTPQQVVERWNQAVTIGTLANWRSKSTQDKPVGPSFQKFGSRVRYPLAAVVAFEQAGLVPGVGAANDNTEAISNTNAA